MDLIQYDPASGTPLTGGTNVRVVPVQREGRTAAAILTFDRKGDTGKREIPIDSLLIVISGEGRVRSGGQIADIKAGDVVVLPGGILHHIWTSDSTLSVALVSLGGGAIQP
jgi:quercetin dioxygenase-like cupin family protein